MKEEGHLGRCYLKGRAGDAANAILTAAGYNFRRILAWLRMLLRLILSVLMLALAGQKTIQPASGRRVSVGCSKAKLGPTRQQTFESFARAL